MSPEPPAVGDPELRKSPSTVAVEGLEGFQIFSAAGRLLQIYSRCRLPDGSELIGSAGLLCSLWTVDLEGQSDPAEGSRPLWTVCRMSLPLKLLIWSWSAQSAFICVQKTGPEGGAAHHSQGAAGVQSGL